MMIFFFFLKHTLIVVLLALSCLWTHRLAAARLPQDEVDALNLITQKMGASGWNFGVNVCEHEYDIDPVQETDASRKITCACQNNTCHIVYLEIKRFGFDGVLPPELVQLPYLEKIDFAFNYFNGSIPSEWASMRLKSISLLGNRLSGKIPNYLGNFSSLEYLNIELNQFSGTVPPELGKLPNLQVLILSSNGLSGDLPMELAELKNLTDFRINDNDFSGSIPNFIQEWRQLTRLEMQGSGLNGPIPSGVSVLEKLTNLRISDINGGNQRFPNLTRMTRLEQLVLRNCNISQEIPSYIWASDTLKTLDLSFNKLSGKLSSSIQNRDLFFVFLSHNMLSGDIPIIRKGIDVDLSYNNFTRQNPELPVCQQTRDINLNLFRSSSMWNDLGGACMEMEHFKCHRYWHSLYVNCGGQAETIDGIKYEGDAVDTCGDAATFYQNDDNWGFSSTGDFLDDNDVKNKASYIASLKSSNINRLYNSARLSPLSLTYYRYCLENGSYNVILHFAEIQFTNDKPYNRLGRRIFDIYIQENLMEKDFNIEAEASGVVTPIKKVYNISVTNGVLEIRFYWAGKGTTRVPHRGVYGPLISAIYVKSSFMR